MTDTPCETYQLAGMDDRQRGFNRVVQLECQNSSYRAAFYYEKTWVRGEPADTTTAALTVLVHALRSKGYSQMRGRLSFRGENYLGSQESWVEYPDPEPTSRCDTQLRGLLRRFVAAFRK